MFKKILIANRGEIACRIAATATRMGIATVAVYSPADAGAAHVAACDEAVPLEGDEPARSYLQGQRLIEAALQTGAEAVHPGYGFLSENAAFAQACADAGLVFIGPPPAAMDAMGLKAQAKRLMAQAGVPLVPGYHGESQEAAHLAAQADQLGYPVLIKASAGGGGRGMRVVEQPQDFAAALAACQREAQQAFGNPAVLIEKYLQRPRHIEIQIFGDSHGQFVHLFERDCSVQRRHQKVLEESPAPGVDEALRQRMGAAAIAAARAVGYVGAGTVEFIVVGDGGSEPHGVGSVGANSFTAGPPPGETAPSGGSEPHEVGSVGALFYFMEMNTRLQVEHAVTEAVTGVDLVEWQLRVAAGERLPLQQHHIQRQGHAIEARVCAENPDTGFLPATGTLWVYRKPPASRFVPAAVRIDDGVRAGDVLSPHYDSLVAKLIVHAPTRAEALARLDQALSQTHTVGVATNLPFLRRLIQSPSFANADLDTGLIERERPAWFGHEPLALPQLVAAAVAYTLMQERLLEDADPFSRRDGWRLWGAAPRRFAFECRGEVAQAVLTQSRGGAVHLRLEGLQGALHFQAAGDAIELTFAGLRERLWVYAQGPLRHVFARQGAGCIRWIDPLQPTPRRDEPDAGRLTAPMPGRVVSFAVAVGDRVTAGQPVAVITAMKMEHTLAAPTAGTVAELLYRPGDAVDEGAELLKLQP